MLNTLLPYRFDENAATIDNLEVNCSGCKTAIAADSIRAEMVSSNSHSVAVNAYAMCEACNLVTPVVARFSSDGGLLQNTSNGWVAGRWISVPKAGIFSQLKAVLGVK